ncbi:hypothetical protein WG66_012288 [Moniliophthora roreri]|nr:hypothetical protein WG66_012288 [Moniliophthora roreri]
MRLGLRVQKQQDIRCRELFRMAASSWNLFLDENDFHTRAACRQARTVELEYHDGRICWGLTLGFLFLIYTYR